MGIILMDGGEQPTNWKRNQGSLRLDIGSRYVQDRYVCVCVRIKRRKQSKDNNKLKFQK